MEFSVFCGPLLARMLIVGNLDIALGITVCRFAMGGIFSTNVYERNTKLSATTKLSAEHKIPPIANVLLAARFYLHAF